MAAVAPLALPSASSSASTNMSPTAHLAVVLLENKSYTDIVGNPNAPYINQTLVRQGRLFTQYYATAHPSLPNYLVLTSGSFAGCTSDSCAVDSVAGNNLFSELTAAGGTWKVYAESMPGNCYRANNGSYAKKVNPAIYYTALDSHSGDGSCANQDVPMTNLGQDLTNNTLPSLAWLAPNIYDDMLTDQQAAPCALGNATQDEVCQGDSWLSTNLPPLLSDGGKNDVTVLVVWDEANRGNSSGGGGQVPAIEIGPHVLAGTQTSTPYTHYNLVNALTAWFTLPALTAAGPAL